MADNLRENEEGELYDSSDEEEEEEQQQQQSWEDWEADEDEEEEETESNVLCLFCDSVYGSSGALFEHCTSTHSFDFRRIRKTLALDFYASFKLINFVRSQVAQNMCWSCGLHCQSNQDLHNHLHEGVHDLHGVTLKDGILPWNDEKFLNPFMMEDPLLYSFDEDDECEDELTTLSDKEELLRNLSSFEQISMSVENENDTETCTSSLSTSFENGLKKVASTPDEYLDRENPEKAIVDGFASYMGSSNGKPEGTQSRISSAKVAENRVINANKNYFSSYSSFGIHREMISDKARTDAYRQAILDNPSLLKSAVVLDVGCGTGILSLFAAQAGASRVFAVEASDKMAAVATQIAKDNGVLWTGNQNKGESRCGEVIEVVHAMVEELETSGHIQPHSIDVLVSEWMGYCLLYESMLSSVLFARDKWLKPGGAILPDTATMFVAGFGKGATSIPFWENVYGFSMSCVGNELVAEAAQVPIIDIVDGNNIVTNTAVLQTFDLVTMKPEEMDFTAMIELKPKLDCPSNDFSLESKTTWCYGVVLWFETCFTARFCKDMPTVLSTSPYTPKTHWSQTILTFRDPIAIVSGQPFAEKSAAVGTESCPAVKVLSRISIVRAPQHRSIDISVEMAGVALDGRKRSWPAQIFNLC
ncbi:hypothetical protein RJ640_015205 [Escallonia rubra]|uniref:C2H2-type domain-containing protein n=1 Tax=Escallonia rubra TaxID=112253 RepID=A0AA88RRR9_9ASTE|nr:hypothetical protein RJ640_015205 [Escallonia rubra]